MFHGCQCDRYASLQTQTRKFITRFVIVFASAIALFAALPMLIVNNMGLGLHRPLGVAVIGGLTMSQMLTLFTTPVIHLISDSVLQRVSAARARRVNVTPISAVEGEP